MPRPAPYSLLQNMIRTSSRTLLYSLISCISISVSITAAIHWELSLERSILSIALSYIQLFSCFWNHWRTTFPAILFAFMSKRCISKAMDGGEKPDHPTKMPLVMPSPRDPKSWIPWIIGTVIMLAIIGSFCPPVHYGMRWTLTSSSNDFFNGADLKLATSSRNIEACMQYAWRHELIGTYASALAKGESGDHHFHFNFLTYERHHLPLQPWGQTIWFHHHSAPSIMLFQASSDLVNDTVLNINVVLVNRAWKPETPFLCSLSSPAIELGNKLRLSVDFYNSACRPTGINCLKPVRATDIAYGVPGDTTAQLIYSHLHYYPLLGRTIPFPIRNTKPFTVIYSRATSLPVAVFPGHFDLGGEDLVKP